MADSYVVKGATLKCSFGDSDSMLDIPQGHNIFINKVPQANVMDYMPNVNIKPFGQCSSLANPTVAAATAVNYGKLQKMPCVPITVAPWAGAQTGLLLADFPALLKSSKLLCIWCGQITIDKDGQ
jgi:hypothetical protein